jgi:PhnB protein
MGDNVKSIPEGYSNVIPYLNIRDAAKAIEFYKNVFDAKEVGRLTTPDGKIGHCELRIGNAQIMLAEESAEWGNKSPQTLGGSSGSVCIYVENVDEVYKKAIDAGAKADEKMELQDQFYGDRSGTVTDPFGHKWTIAKHIEDVSFEEIQHRFNEMFEKHSV